MNFYDKNENNEIRNNKTRRITSNVNELLRDNFRITGFNKIETC